MKTVKEVRKLTGVRVRTLHHYDTIGPLKPTRVTDTALGRLQNFLLFRELQFPAVNWQQILGNCHHFNIPSLCERVYKRSHYAQNHRKSGSQTN